MSDILIPIEPAPDYNDRTQKYLMPPFQDITASEVMAEFEKRCGSGQQYTTFPNTISDDEKSKLEAAGYVVTANTIDSENIDGVEPTYIGFQVALNDTAAAKNMVIGQKGENGIGGGGGSTLIEKSISANGIYNASEDSADGYSKVTVDVPNTYTAQDEGKVVDNGALVAQTAMSSEVTENGTVDTTLYNSVTVNVPSGGGGSSSNAVNFYDYDGTIVNSYTAAEFAELTAMPSNPSHEGLTAQGWNWSLSDAKTYVSNHGKLDIGQMYITADGKTRIYITLEEGRISPLLELYLNDNSELDIDWGDGSTHSTFTSTAADFVNERHNYSTSGDYVIAITAVSGSFVIRSSFTASNPYGSSLLSNGDNAEASPDTAYRNSVKKIEIGNSITGIGERAFGSCYSLISITIPNSITEIGNQAFLRCYSLLSVTSPNSVLTLGRSAFSYCVDSTSISLGNLITNIGSFTFQYCASLTSIALPDSITEIDSYAFENCHALKEVILPTSLTTFGEGVFYYCYNLSEVVLPTGLTSLPTYTFYACYSLKSINIPNTVTTIGGSAFNGCNALKELIIPEGVTTISAAFTACCSITSITIPSTVTSMSGAFYGCYSLATITINKPEGSLSGSPWSAKTTPPTSTQIIWTG